MCDTKRLLEQIQMSKTLDMITVKLNALDDRCEPVDADICFRHGTAFVKLPVPPTVVGRETLRALLVLAGRHEQDMINKQSRAFDAAAGSGRPKVFQNSYNIE
jgi:hypothetical protein